MISVFSQPVFFGFLHRDNHLEDTFYFFWTYTMHVQVYIKNYIVPLKNWIPCTQFCTLPFHLMFNLDILYPHIVYHNDLTSSILIDI